MSKLIETKSLRPDIIPVNSVSYYLSLQEESNNRSLDLVTLRKFLSVVLPQEEQPTRDQVRDIIDTVGQPQRLDRIVQSILTDPEQLEKIASKSFGHSTGMDRIELASHGDFSLRLHFWMPGNGESITEDPHSHVYNFGSKVLSGVLLTDLFTQGEDGIDMNMYQIATQNTQHKPTPELIGKVRLQYISPPQGIVRLDGDPTYTMSHKVIHRVRQGDQQSPIITLNLRGGNIKDQSTFFRDERMQPANSTPMLVDVESRLGLLHHIFAR